MSSAAGWIGGHGARSGDPSARPRACQGPRTSDRGRSSCLSTHPSIDFSTQLFPLPRDAPATGRWVADAPPGWRTWRTWRASRQLPAGLPVPFGGGRGPSAAAISGGVPPRDARTGTDAPTPRRSTGRRRSTPSGTTDLRPASPRRPPPTQVCPPPSPREPSHAAATAPRRRLAARTATPAGSRRSRPDHHPGLLQASAHARRDGAVTAPHRCSPGRLTRALASREPPEVGVRAGSSRCPMRIRRRVRAATGAARAPRCVRFTRLRATAPAARSPPGRVPTGGTHPARRQPDGSEGSGCDHP
jgi:hypothetical protein